MGLRFTTRKILILWTYTDAHKATAYSWLIKGNCNKNYSRWQIYFPLFSLFGKHIVFFDDWRNITSGTSEKNEIQKLRERLSMGTPTVHEKLSLISLVRKWWGLESAIPLEVCFDSIESSAQMGRWDEIDRLRIATLHLTDAAKIFIMVVQNSMKKT